MSIRRVLGGASAREPVETADVSALLFSGLAINGAQNKPRKQTQEPTKSLALPVAGSAGPASAAQLFGWETMERLMRQMLKLRHVVGGSEEEMLLKRIGEGTDFERASAWEMLATDVEQMISDNMVGRGGFNRALRFNVSDLETLPDYATVRQVLDADSDLILRISRVTDERGFDRRPFVRDAVTEVVISAYASFYKIGPRLVAAWLTPPRLKGYAQVDDDSFTLGGVGDDKIVLSMVTEKWAGDLSSPIRQRTMQPQKFAEQFSKLVRKSIDIGFWQTDCKPSNMLFRYAFNSASNDLELELAWTDFDPSYCYVLSSNVNERLKACSALAHVASFMGAVSCGMGEDSFAHYLPAVKAQFSRDFQIDEIRGSDVCSWLEVEKFSPTQNPTAFDKLVDSAKRTVAETLLLAMRNYMVKQEYRYGRRCVLRFSDSDPEPTFQQLLDFAYFETESYNPPKAPEVSKEEAEENEELGPYADMLRDAGVM